MPSSSDIAKLLLRVSLGVFMLFHGFYKVVHGIGGVEAMLSASSLPLFLAYGVYIGELIAPLFIILGLYARIASLILALNMLAAMYLAYGFSFGLGKYGGLLMESPLMFFLIAIAIALLGSGKYSINNK